MDAILHRDTPSGHPPIGTVRGLAAVTRDDVRSFYASMYRPEYAVIGLSSADPRVSKLVSAAVNGIGGGAGAGAARISSAPRQPGAMPRGRHVLVVTEPNAIATGVHAGFPIDVKRGHPDYWPLYVANVHFGTHRDGFSHLYKRIRQERGYNYGDYSYIEWFPGRFAFLFPPTNVPRSSQDFTIWIRPIQHQYTVHLMKALTFELDRYVAQGLTEEEVALAKNKARVLYLSLGETTARRVGYRIDDVVYGMNDRGFLDGYLQSIDAVTTAQVNAAIRAHLQADNVQYVVVTDEKVAPKLLSQLKADEPAFGKDAKAYAFEAVEENGQTFYKISDVQVDTLRRDGMWAAYPLNLAKGGIQTIKAADLFETAAFPTTTP